MCFSPPLSAAIGTSAFVAAALLAKRGRPLRCYCLFLYFGLMEFLQLAQYAVADQCSNPVNQWLTWLAYVHVAFQPLMANLFFLYGQRNPHPEVGSFVLKLCAACGVWMLMRTPLLPLTKLGDLLHHVFPDIPTSDSYGKHCHYLEAFCGQRTCSFIGGAWGHISWELPLAPSTYLLPGASLHFAMFFLPTLVAGSPVKRLLMVITIFIGPLASMYIARANMDTYPFEWATIWCFFAAVQSLWAVMTETLLYVPGFKSADPEEMAIVGKWRRRDSRVTGKGSAAAEAGGSRGRVSLLLDSPSDRAPDGLVANGMLPKQE